MNRIERLAEALPESVQCALITSDINRRYFTGMKSSAGVLVCFKEKSYLIIDFRYIEKARAVVKSCEVIEMQKLSVQIGELLKKHKVGKVSVEADSMTIAELNRYKTSLPEVEFDICGDLSKAIAKLRSCKSKFELEKMSQAQGIAEKAFEHILSFIRAGRTEREIALELDYFMHKSGAESVSFDTIALSGSNTSMPHGVPSSKEVFRGELVLMDFGAVVDGMHSDMTRTICVGEPTADMEKAYATVLKAQLAALAAVRAGMKCSELDAVARDIIYDAGYEGTFGHSLGHGVGLEIHEAPTVSEKSETILSEGMVITVEPGIYIPGKFGIRIEDMVSVSAASSKNMTAADKKLICL